MKESGVKVSTKQDALLRSVQDMVGYRVFATDGELGEVRDIYFDDEKWVVRHLVVDIGERAVLLSPIAFKEANWDARVMNVSLSLEQIKNSPDIDTDQPISRQMEAKYYDHHGWPYYWGGMFPWGGGMFPYAVAVMSEQPDEKKVEPTESETHLRSANAITGYSVEATDGGIGNVEDFIINDARFDVRFVVIDTTPWWFGGKVLLPVEHIKDVDWQQRRMTLDTTQAEVKKAPHWDHAKPVNITYAESVQNHYK